MASTAQTISIRKGENQTLKITVSDKDDNAVDLTGYEAQFTVKESEGDATEVFNKRTSGLSGGADTQVLLDPDQSTNPGVVRVFILPTDTSSLDCETLRYDFWVRNTNVSPNTDHSVIDPNQFEVKNTVTVLP